MLDKVATSLAKENNVEIHAISDLPPKKVDGVTTNHFLVKPWKGFILRNLWILFCLPIIHKRIANKLNIEYDSVFTTHDYFTKSPYILRYLKIPSIYLCQEPQREFYEPWNVHSPTLKDKLVNMLRYPIKVIDENNVRFANTVLSNSKYSKKIIDRIYGVKSKIIYPGVDEFFFKPIKVKKDKSLLCVGGLNPIKDQLFIIKALKPLLKKYKLVLIGSGKNEYINKIYKEIGSDSKVEIEPSVSDIELRTLYCKASVTLIAAHCEPFGLSSIESQACGTPVVAVEEGGLMENIINKKTGYLVKRDKKDFLIKVKLAIKNNKKMGEDARKNIIREWTWDKTLKKLPNIK